MAKIVVKKSGAKVESKAKATKAEPKPKATSGKRTGDPEAFRKLLLETDMKELSVGRKVMRLILEGKSNEEIRELAKLPEEHGHYGSWYRNYLVRKGIATHDEAFSNSRGKSGEAEEKAAKKTAKKTKAAKAKKGAEE